MSRARSHECLKRSGQGHGHGRWYGNVYVDRYDSNRGEVIAGKDWTVTVPVVAAACGTDVYREAVFDLRLVSVSVCLLVELAQRHIDLCCISHKRRHRECKQQGCQRYNAYKAE